MEVLLWTVLFASVVIPGCYAPLKNASQINPAHKRAPPRDPPKITGEFKVEYVGGLTKVHVNGAVYTLDPRAEEVWGSIRSKSDLQVEISQRWGNMTRESTASTSTLPSKASLSTSEATDAWTCPINDPFELEMSEPGKYKALLYTRGSKEEDSRIKSGYVRILTPGSHGLRGIVSREVANDLVALGASRKKLEEAEDLYKTVEDLKAKNGVLVRSKDDLISRMAVLKKELAMLQTKPKRDPTDVARITELEMAIKRFERLEEKLESVTISAEKAQELNDALTTKMAALEKEKTALNVTAKTNSAAAAKVTELEGEIKNLKLITCELQASIASAAKVQKKEVDSLTAEKAQIEVAKIELEKKVADLENRLKSVEAEKKKLGTEAGQKQNAVARQRELEEEVAQLSKTLKVVEEQLKVANNASNARGADAKKAAEKVKELENELQKANISMSDLNEVAESLRVEIQHHKDTIKGLTSDKKVIAEESERRVNELEVEVEVLKRFRDELEGVKKELEETKEKEKAAKSEVKQLKAQLSAAELRAEILEARIKEVMDARDGLQREMQEDQKKIMEDKHASILLKIEKEHEDKMSQAAAVKAKAEAETIRYQAELVKATKAFEAEIRDQIEAHTAVSNKIVSLQQDFSNLEKKYHETCIALGEEREAKRITREKHAQQMIELEQTYHEAREALTLELERERRLIIAQLDEQHKKYLADITRVNDEVQKLKLEKQDLARLKKEGESRLKSAKELHAKEKQLLENDLVLKNTRVEELEATIERERTVYKQGLDAANKKHAKNRAELLKQSAELWDSYQKKLVGKEDELITLRRLLSLQIIETLSLRNRLEYMISLQYWTETARQSVARDYDEAQKIIQKQQQDKTELQARLANAQTTGECFRQIYRNIRDDLGQRFSNLLPAQLISIYNAMASGWVKVRPLAMFFTFATAFYYLNYKLAKSPQGAQQLASVTERPLLPPVGTGPAAPMPGAVPAAISARGGGIFGSYWLQMSQRWFYKSSKMI
ncbi:hypothetical protein DdX_12949 [Ditylenchus destructor]|uniref:Uncharacterized protein n=1 Tax=Ditylenchus destructor TaxID=166010 RepID=A0AAD4MZG8_9BILA|nr:hypothetical protein DdX_12949 [Ditylenchus destructor]